MSDREAVLSAVEQLVASAVGLLHPLCGEQLTVGIIAQIAEDQAKFRALVARVERQEATAPIRAA